MRIDDAEVALPEDQAATSLGSRYQCAVRRAREAIDWYDGAAGRKGWWARVVTGLAVVLFGLGGLIPLAKAATLTNGDATWGYILVGVGGIAVLYDRFFGLSSGWTRYRLAELKLRRILNEFLDDWHKTAFGKDLKAPPDDVALDLLARIAALNASVHETVREETETWAAEFRSNVVELGKLISDEKARYQSALDRQRSADETRKDRSGNVRIRVPNVADFERVLVRLDGREKELGNGGATALFGGVAAGTYELEVVGTRNGQSVRAADFVEVKPGEIASHDVDVR